MIRSVRCAKLKALLLECSGEGIEHDINATVSRDSLDIVGEIKGPGVHDVLHTQRLKEIPLRLAARCREHGRSNPLCQLHCRETNAARDLGIRLAAGAP